MDWKRIGILCLVGAMLAMLVAGCSTGGKQADGKGLRVAIGSEPQTIDPRRSTGVPESTVQNQIFEGLCARDGNGNPVPGVAEKWDISADGLKYTFYLRENAKWSNGDPVTAQDFEFAWKTTLSPELGSEYAEQLYYLKNGAAYNKKNASADQVGVKALNDRTLEVTLEKPTAYFLSLLAFHTYYPVHKKTVESNPNWAADVKTIIGNGPFKMTAWTHNSKIELVKNDKYWDAAKVKLDRLDLILSDSNTTVLSMYENNQVDVVEEPVPPVAEIPRLKKENKIKVYPYLGTYFYEFNTKKAPFDNPKVRKAFALAIDRETLISTVTKIEEKPALGWVPTGLNDAKSGEEFRKVGGDLFKDKNIEEAKKLLAEAGYPDGKGLPAVTLLFNTNERHKAIAEAIQEMWKKNLGVTVNLANQEWKVYLQSRTAGDFQVARAGWIGDYTDPMTFMDMMVTGNGNNRARWSNPEYDRLVNVAKGTMDQGVRMQAMHDAEKILIDEMPVLPIYFYTRPILEKANLKGVVRSADGMSYYKAAYLE